MSAPTPPRADPTPPPPGAAGSAPPPTAPSSPPPSRPATAGHLRRAGGPARRRRHAVARGLASRASPLARAPTLPCDVADDGVQQLGYLQRRTGGTATSQRRTQSPTRAPM